MARLAPITMILAVLAGGAVAAPAGTQLLAQDTTGGPGIATSNLLADASTSAPSSTVVETASAPTPTDRGQDALELIAYNWQAGLPGWSIVFAPGREHVLGLTYVDTKTIEIYVRDDQTPALLAHVIAHEMGHAVDVTLNDGDERRRWQETRGVGTAPWWPGEGATDFSTGAGDFAESFAAWQVGPGNFRSKLADAPSAEQLGLLAELSEA